MRSAKSSRPPECASTSTHATKKMNAKIREHAMQKVPFQLVLGDREVEAHEVNVRVRGQEKAEGSVPVEAFVERVTKLIDTKSSEC